MASFLKNILPKLTWISRTHISPKFTSVTIASQKGYSNISSPTPYEIVEEKNEEAQQLVTSDLVKKISEKLEIKNEPLFAIVHVAGKQFRIVKGDMIVVEGYWPPDTGDKITLDKIMLIGARDFSLIGRPLIQNDLVKIEATVIEKTVSHTKTHFRKKRRKQYKRIHFYRIPQTMLQINDIKFIGDLNNPPEITHVKSRTI